MNVFIDDNITQSVDSPEDVPKVESLMLVDEHFPTYLTERSLRLGNTA